VSWLVLAVAAVPGLACGGGTVAEGTTPGTVANVGALPEPFEIPDRSDAGAPASATRAPAATTDAADTTAVPPTPETAETVATAETTAVADTAVADTAAVDVAEGNRILAIGDSITAAIGPDYGGQLCADLGRRGWEVAVDAEQNRDVTAGRKALERRLAEDDGWDAAIVNLGSNYRQDPVEYAAELRRILGLLRPRPVIVVTVTEFEESVAEVNYVIRDITRDMDGVQVVEWSERTRVDDELTGADGLHLSEPGRELLASLLASAVGRAPDARPTDQCVALTDDAAAGDATGGEESPSGGTAENADTADTAGESATGDA
jgi:lysophospholipase L1-like esterase